MTTAKQFKDLFADKSYADDTPIKIGDVETTLGDVRSLTAAEQRRVADQAAELAASQKELEAAQTNLATNFSKLVEAGMVTVDRNGQIQFVEPPKPGTSAAPAGGTKQPDYERDTYVGPLYKMVKELSEQLKTHNANAQQLAKTVNGSRTIYENDRLRNEFNRYEDWPEDLNFDRALARANEQQLKDQYGRLDLSRLHDEVSKPLRFSQKELDAKADELANQRVQERLAAMTRRPGQTARTPIKPNTKFKNIDAAFDSAINDAASDPDIQQQLQSIIPGVVQ